MSKKKQSSQKEVFLKTIVFTAAVLALLAIGYLSAGYFFG